MHTPWMLLCGYTSGSANPLLVGHYLYLCGVRPHPLPNMPHGSACINIMSSLNPQQTRELQNICSNPRFWIIPVGWRQDASFVLAALEVLKEVRLDFLQDAKLLKDPKFVRQMICICPVAIQYASRHLDSYEDLAMLAVTMDSGALKVLPYSLHDNREIVRAALRQDGRMLRHASLRLREDQGMFQLLPPSLQQDQSFVLFAVLNGCGMHLRYAPNWRKHNKSVVLAAVSDHGLALKFASSELQHDLEVVAAAVQNDGEAIEFAQAIDPHYLVQVLSRKRHKNRRTILKYSKHLLRTFWELRRSLGAMDAPNVVAWTRAYRRNLRVGIQELKSILRNHEVPRDILFQVIQYDVVHRLRSAHRLHHWARAFDAYERLALDDSS